MVYTVYLGLSNEYEILQSEEFRERISDISDEEDVAVGTSGGDIVTDVREGTESGSGD
jgi:choline/glycine/proline betaine transport protein